MTFYSNALLWSHDICQQHITVLNLVVTLQLDLGSFFTSINEIIAFCVYSGYFCPILKFDDLKHLCKKISNGEWCKYFSTVLYNNSHIICSHIKAIFLISFFNMTPSQNGLKTRSNFSESLLHELDEWSLKNRKKKCLKNIISITFDRLSILKKMFL